MPSKPRPQVAVSGVAVSGGRLLLVRRGRGAAAGQWSLPGGRVEHGEPLAQALRREVAEETGLAAEVGALCGIAERIGDQHYVIIDFWLEVSGQARPGDDADEVRWVTRDELLSLPVTEGLIDFLRAHGVWDLLT